MQEFGMFTDQGEELANEIVALARKYALNDRSIEQMLWALAENEAFSELSDTVVRENVFDAVQTCTL